MILFWLLTRHLNNFLNFKITHWWKVALMAVFLMTVSLIEVSLELKTMLFAEGAASKGTTRVKLYQASDLSGARFCDHYTKCTLRVLNL